jgi:hypothetical protein
MPEETPTPAPVSTDTGKVLDRLLAKFGGDTNTVALKLIKLNGDLGVKLAAAEARATAAEAKAAPLADVESKLTAAEAKAADLDARLKAAAIPEGHVAIPKSDSELLASYKALGEPAAIKASVDRLPALESEVARRDREAELGAVAAVLRYEPAVLSKLADGLKFVPAKAKDRGKEIDSFNVVDTGPDGKERTRPIADLEKDDWRPWLAALRPEPETRARAIPVGGSPYRGDGRHVPEPEPAPRRGARQEREDDIYAEAAKVSII